MKVLYPVTVPCRPQEYAPEKWVPRIRPLLDESRLLCSVYVILTVNLVKPDRALQEEKVRRVALV